MESGRRDIIAITTHNRLPELIACAACLREVRGVERYRILIRDDASTDYDVDAIRQLFPQAERIERNASRLGADANHLRFLRDCLAEGAPRIFVLDSDMILSPAALEFAGSAFGRTDGVLGLYNSLSHPELRAIDAELVEKGSIGGAAALWDAALLRECLHPSRGAWTWDWEVIKRLAKLGRRVIASQRSYAQHLGLSGENNRWFGAIDYGRGFVVETNTQARFMAAAFGALLTNQHAYIRTDPP